MVSCLATIGSVVSSSYFKEYLHSTSQHKQVLHQRKHQTNPHPTKLIHWHFIPEHQLSHLKKPILEKLVQDSTCVNFIEELVLINGQETVVSVITKSDSRSSPFAKSGWLSHLLRVSHVLWAYIPTLPHIFQYHRSICLYSSFNGRIGTTLFLFIFVNSTLMFRFRLKFQIQH